MPHDIQLSKDHKKLYVVNVDSATLTIIDTVTNDIEGSIYVHENPYHMALNKDGSLIFIVNTSFSSKEEGSVTILNSKELKVIDRIRVGKMPMEVVTGKDENILYITDAELNAINIVNVKEKRLMDRVFVGRMPGSIRKDHKGKYLFIGNMQDNSVTIMDIKALKTLKTIPVGIEPNGIVCI
jgi:YVTN family beta-propeller protein